ncbi:hypothetical protein HYU17_02190 [Candidatus Woesearchaeota archaeon]|nr:hypothetical protein [Candidatus Woesearchaeota archaeon]
MRNMTPEEEEIKEEDIIGEVHVTIASDAFSKPITCCSRKTKKATKGMSLKGQKVTYDVWKCGKCEEEYLDSQQAEKLEDIWAIQKFLEGKSPTMERSLNYDGKTYFVRFPKDLTAGWAKQKKEKARLTMLSPDRYLVEVA